MSVSSNAPPKVKRPGFMSRLNLKLRRISASSGNSVQEVVVTGRGGRRQAFSAVHFKKEKIMKQLQTAIERADVSGVEDVVEVVDVTELEDDSLSFVRRACQLANLEVIAALLRNGAGVNLIGESNLTGLHIASKTGNAAMAALLLSSNANPNVQAKYEKKTPLHVTALEGHIEVMRLLIANGADVNAPDIYGSRPIHLACRMGRNLFIKVLLENRAHIDTYDNEGWTGLHLAAEAGHEHTVKLLLDNNANIDSQSKYGRTALHWACASGHVTVVHALLQGGANANIKDLHDRLPLYYVKDDRIRTLVQIHTRKNSAVPEKGFASSIGLYLNSEKSLLLDNRAMADGEGIAKTHKRESQDLRNKQWESTDPISSLSQTSSTLDVCTTASYNSSYRASHSKISSTIIVHSDPEDAIDAVDNPMQKTTQEKPSLSTTFQKLVNTTSGHFENVDNSVDELQTVLNLVSDDSIQLNKDSINEYISKLVHITRTLKSMKESFYRDTDTMKTVLDTSLSEGKLIESGNPGYIAIVQLFLQCLTQYIGSFANGWKAFLKHLPYTIENRDLLEFQIQLKQLSEAEKAEQVIMHWARSCDSNAQVTYMNTLLSSLNRCDLGRRDDEDKTNHVDNVIQQLLCLETSFKSGNSENRSNKVSSMISSLSDKNVRQLLQHIESSDVDLNVFPTLDELSVSESDNETVGKSRNLASSTKSVAEKLEEMLIAIIEEEDNTKLGIVIKHLIMCGRENLLTNIL